VANYTISNIANFWLRAGGSPAHMVAAVSVSQAESGGNSSAISPSNDWGLWQINIVNFHWLGVSTGTIRDPLVNAHCAVVMSGNGTNWAPWCTCWTNPARDCGHGNLPLPQRGSPAEAWLTYVAHILKVIPPVRNPGVDGPGQYDATQGYNAIRQFVGPDARAKYRRAQSIRNAIRRI
jgi:hypothetical protein